MGYLNHKYLYQGYPVDIPFQSARGPCRLGSLAAPSGPGRHSPLRTILCHCDAPLLSLSHRQAPQTRFALPKLPQPLVDLVHVASLPAHSSAASASPCGNLAPMCWRSWYGMVGVELQTLSTVSEALDLGGQRLFLLADQPENLPIRRRQNMKGICIIMAYPWDILTDKRRDILS